MQHPIYDRAVVPGEDAVSDADMVERLETILTKISQKVADDGGVPIQHELILCTRPVTDQVSISYSISDPSGHLTTGVPEWHDINPCGSYTDPARSSFAAAWSLPPDSGPDRPTDLEALRKQDHLKQAARETILVRMVSAEQIPPRGGGEWRPPQERLPDGVEPWDVDRSLLPIVRGLRNRDSKVLFRIHLDPVFRVGDELVSAEDCYHTDSVVAADVGEIEAVGYRPTIEAAIRSSGNEKVSDASLLEDYLSTVFGDVGYRPKRYWAEQPVEERNTLKEILEEGSPTMEYSEKQLEVIADGLARMKVGRGRPLRDEDGDRIELTTMASETLGSLCRIPAAPTLAREGIVIPGVESTLSNQPREVTRDLLAERGLTLGMDPGVVEDSIRLKELVTPPTQTIISDDPQTFVEVLAQQTVQRDTPRGTTIVVDPTGDLATALEQSCSEQYEDVDREVVRWDVASNPPALAPFDSNGLVDAGWDRGDAVEFVAETHDHLLQAADPDYRIKTPPDTIGPGTTSQECQQLFRAAFHDAAPDIDYSTIVTRLDDDWTRRELSQYVPPRCDTDVSATIAETAYHHAVDLHDALDSVLPTTEPDSDRIGADFISECPNAIICLDVSGFDSGTNQRLAMVLLLRTLTYSLVCTDSTELPPMTLSFAGVSRFSTTDFLTPLISHARDPTSSSLNVVFGNLCDGANRSIAHPSLTHETPLYLVATTPTFATHENVEWLIGRFPEAVPDSLSCIKEQATDRRQTAVALAEECLPAGNTPISCVVSRPTSHTVQKKADTPSTTGDLEQSSQEAAETLPGVAPPRNTSSNTTEKTRRSGASEREMGGDTNAIQQVTLTTGTTSTTARSEAPQSASNSVGGVSRTYKGPMCEVCGTLYSRVAEAAACHVPTELETTQSIGQSVTSCAPPDLAYSERLLDCLNANTTSNIGNIIWSVTEQPSREDAFASIKQVVLDDPPIADPWSVTFLFAIELARLGGLPGYTLHESMTTIRDDCLSQSAYTIDQLLDPPSHAEFDNPLVSIFKFDGNRYYELSSESTLQDEFPCSMESMLPVLGTPLRYNLGVVFGSHHVASEYDVSWIQAPHVLSAAGVDAFAGFADDNTLQVLGTVIHTDPYDDPGSPEQNADTGHSGQLRNYIKHQYRRAADMSAEAVWVTRNTRVAKGVLDVLAEEGQIDLPRAVSDSAYSVGQLQARFVDDLQPDGLDSLHTLKQLHQPK